VSQRFLVPALLALAFIGLAVTPAPAGKYSPRQYYGGWHKHDRQNYYYRYYYYKPRENYSGYKHHYAIYYPSKPNYYYYYNPYKKQYWGRCPSKYDDGKGTYSMLADEDRKGSLEDIDEKSFPKPGPLPKIPDSEDDATLELPPDDLPTGGGLPVDKGK